MYIYIYRVRIISLKKEICVNLYLNTSVKLYYSYYNKEVVIVYFVVRTKIIRSFDRINFNLYNTTKKKQFHLFDKLSTVIRII